MGLTQTQLGEKVGLGLRAIQKLEDNIFPKFKRDSIIAIDNFLGTNLCELIYEQKQHEVKENQISKEPESPNYIKKRFIGKIESKRTLDYYETGAKASTENTGEILPVTKPIGKVVIDELFKGSQYAIRVSGNSMTPNYPSGCIIGIRLIEDFMINPGSVYVIETGNDLWIKRLYYLNNDRSSETIVLMSDNKIKEESGERQGQYCYPSFTLHKSEVKNLFRVTGVFKSNMLTVIEH